MNRSAIHALMSSPVADVACDVGEAQLNLICSAVAHPGFAATWEIQNRTEAIRVTLEKIRAIAVEAGYAGLRVIACPTEGRDGSVASPQLSGETSGKATQCCEEAGRCTVCASKNIHELVERRLTTA